ncbi:hypothetical protein HY632_00370 [Candidatus Uhrbacteria bacterium]|nr:hypothetical protein [Candidatus Uhrbacteria bacterium]
MEEQRRIVLAPDGRATYEALRVVPLAAGAGTKERLTQTKSADTRVLFPEDRGLFLQPRNCVLAETVGAVTLLVVEDRPMVRTVQWRLDAAEYLGMRDRLLKSGAHRIWGVSREAFAERLHTQEQFVLAFPFLVKFYRFLHGVLDQVFLYYRTAPITDLHDDLFIPNLPNRRQREHQLCLPKLTKALASEHLSIRQYVERVELEFWGSVWNVDWCEDFFACAQRIPEVGSPWEWERQSQQNARCMCALPWEMHERTVLQEFQYRMRESVPAAERLFDVLTKKILDADDFDAPVPTEGASVVPVSTTQLLAVQHEMIRVGDTLVIVPGTCRELPEGGTGCIEWFSRLVRGQRYVKLQGHDAPVRLTDGGALRRGVQITHATPPPEVVYDGVRIVPGTVIRFLDPVEWPGHATNDYVVQMVRGDATGTVRVQFRGDQGTYVVLGTITEPFPGFRCYPQEAVDEYGMCRARMVTLADGTTVQHGTELLWDVDDRIQRIHVDAIVPLGGTRERSGRRIRDGRNQSYIRIDDAAGALAPNFCVRPAESMREVMVGGQMVRCGDRLEWDGGPSCMVMELSPAFPNGRQAVLLDSVGWVPLALHGRWNPRLRVPVPVVVDVTGCTVGDVRYPVGLSCLDREARQLVTITEYRIREHGAVTAVTSAGVSRPFVRRGKRLPSLLPLSPEVMVGTCCMRRSMRVRLVVPVGDFPVGTRDTVLGIIEHDVGMYSVLFVSGRAIAVTRENVACIEVRVGTTWTTLDGSTLPTNIASVQRPIDGRTFRLDDRVHVTGDRIEPATTRVETQAAIARTPATVIARDGEYWKVRFDRHIDGYAGGNICYVHLEGLACSVDVRTAGYPQFLTRPHRARCIQRGAPAGKDTHGQKLQVGDRVRPLDLAGSSTVRAHERRSEGQACTIVHASKNHIGQRWLWLSMGTDVGQRPEQTDFVQRAELPPHLQENRRWWASIAWALPECCERLTRDTGKKEKP